MKNNPIRNFIKFKKLETSLKKLIINLIEKVDFELDKTKNLFLN